ncbi:hypothetical protein ACCT30_49480, partial [Rhizobium ruizarguesonis]
MSDDPLINLPGAQADLFPAQPKSLMINRATPRYGTRSKAACATNLRTSMTTQRRYELISSFPSP